MVSTGVVRRRVRARNEDDTDLAASTITDNDELPANFGHDWIKD